MSTTDAGNWLVTWLKAARAPFLIVSAVPACLGGAIAYARSGQSGFDLLGFALALIGVLMAQSAADFLDDYHDYRTGVLGHKEEQFHDSPLLAGQVSPRQVLAAGLGCAFIAFGVGVYFLWRVTVPVLVLASIGGLIVFFYTAPPLRLNFRGFGELALFLAFGPLLTLGVTTVLVGHLELEAALAGVPLGIFTMNVGHISNLFDVPSDRASGKRTIAVRLGQRGSVWFLAVLSALAYLTLVVAVIAGVTPRWSLLGLATLPLAANVVRLAARYERQRAYTPAMAQAIALTTITGLILTVAYVLAK